MAAGIESGMLGFPIGMSDLVVSSVPGCHGLSSYSWVPALREAVQG